jgi:hypothetical protein
VTLLLFPEERHQDKPVSEVTGYVLDKDFIVAMLGTFRIITSLSGKQAIALLFQPHSSRSLFSDLP